MVRAGYLERSKALKLLEEREQEGLPEGFLDFMKSIDCTEAILTETEGRSTLDFPGRNGLLRKVAMKVRKMLP